MATKLRSAMDKYRFGKAVSAGKVKAASSPKKPVYGRKSKSGK